MHKAGNERGLQIMVSARFSCADLDGHTSRSLSAHSPVNAKQSGG